MQFDKRYEEAMRLLQDKRTEDAAVIFQALVDEFPSHPEYLAGLCNTAMMRNQPEAALPLVNKLLTLVPGNMQVKRQLSMIYNNLGSRLTDTEDYAPAENRLRKAVEQDPDNHLAWFNLGMVLKSLNSHEPAASALQRAVNLQPEIPEYKVALARSQIRFNAAAANHTLDYILQQLPQETSLRLAILELVIELRGKDIGLQFLRKHVDTGPEPDLEQLPFHARLQERLMLLDDAVATSQRSLAHQPDQWDLRLSLAWRLNQAGRHHDAIAEYAALHKSAPNRYYPLVASQLLLPGVYENVEQLQESRNRFHDGITRLEETRHTSQFSQDIRLEDLAWSNFYLAYQGQDDLPLQQRFGQLLTHQTARWQQTLATPPPRAKKRIVFISSFLRDCTVGHYFLSWLEALSNTEFDVVPVQLGRLDDWMTTRIEKICGSLVRVRDGIEEKLMAIRELRADIIIYPELGMDAATFLLASFRLAPLQLCGWGHPVTTGLRTIDYYLSCAEMEPAGAQAQYSESLLLLPGIGTSYQLPTDYEEGSRSTFGLPEKVLLLLFPHAPFKVHPDNDAMIAGLLMANPKAILVLCEGGSPSFSKLMFKRLSMVLEQYGIDANQRVRRLPHMSRSKFLLLNRCCDLMVDCLHWSGGNTSLDALASHLPLVTTSGTFMRGRQSTVMLRALGCEELVCKDTHSLIDKVTQLTTNQDYKHSIAARIEKHRDSLFNRSEGPTQLVTFVRGLLH